MGYGVRIRTFRASWLLGPLRMGLSFDLLGYKSFLALGPLRTFGFGLILWLWEPLRALALDESFGFGTSPTELL